MITIDFWSDFACPFCYIAEQRVKNIVKDLGLEDQVRYKMHSFELDPQAPVDFVAPTPELMAQKYGMTLDEANERIALINKMAQEEGIIGFDDAKTQVVNSMDAHCLVKYAQMKRDQQKTDALIERLFKAFFIDFQNIADHEVLLSIAEEVGFNRADVQQMLESGQYKILVQQDELELVSAGLNSVPFFLIAGRGVAGAQPREVFENVIKEAAEIEGAQKEAQSNINPNDGMNCGPNGCQLN